MSTLKFVTKGKGTTTTKIILKKNEVERITLPYFLRVLKLHYQGSVVLSMQKTHRSMGQKKLSISSLEQYNQLIFNKIEKCNSTDNSIEMNLDLHLTHY